MNILNNHNNRINYLKNLIEYKHINGSHDSENGLRGELGITMKKLKESEQGSCEVEELLQKLYEIIKPDFNYEDFNKQYEQYLLLLSQRQDRIEQSKKYWYWNQIGDVPILTKNNWNAWGSKKTILFGEIVTKCLEEYTGIYLHPIFGSLLSPTGGLVGPGNSVLYDDCYESSIVLHGITHDAFGYLYNYHFNIGCGYNYLDTWWTMFPKSSPLCCQAYGIKWWSNITRDISKEH